MADLKAISHHVPLPHRLHAETNRQHRPHRQQDIHMALISDPLTIAAGTPPAELYNGHRIFPLLPVLAILRWIYGHHKMVVTMPGNPLQNGGNLFDALMMHLLVKIEHLAHYQGSEHRLVLLSVP
jgi:hypothetical protein